jgi:hypothetical protein
MADAPLEELPPDENLQFELGDRILLLGGRVDKLRGRIYYIDEDLIRILPDGVSDRLVDIPIVDGDLDPALGIDTLYSIEKRTKPAFVSIIDAHAEQTAETFDATGEPGPTYTIVAVDEEADKLLLRDETGADLEVEFNFVGIPRDLPFAVLRPRQPPTEEGPGPNEEEEAAAAAAAAAEEAEEEAYMDEFTDVVAAAPRAIPTGIEIREIPASQRFYPAAVQRSDMLEDFLLALGEAARKNPQNQDNVRALVEQCMMLRDNLVLYNRSGDPVGQAQTSYLTLADALAAVDAPLARNVVEAKKVLFLDHTPMSLIQIRDGVAPSDPTELPGVNVEVKYLDESVAAANAFMETADAAAAAAALNAAADSLPNWFIAQETFNRQFHTTWTPAGDKTIPFRQDKDFLRAPAPMDLTTEEVDGLRAKVGDKKSLVSAESVGKTLLGLQRGLGPRTTRLREKEGLRRVEAPEEGSVLNTLLFPLSEQRNLGAIRSGILAKDMALNQRQPESLAEILERLDGIPDEATAGGILCVGPGGNTQGNIPLEDWLRVQPIYPLGLADVLVDLANYGLGQAEFNVDQQAVLLERIDTYRALVKQYILELRDAAKAALAQVQIKQNPFLTGEAFSDVLETLATEPLLAARMDDLRARIPAYKDNDIAMFAGLLATSADLVLTALAQQPGPLAKERNRKVRDQFLEVLRDALARAEKSRMAGEQPTPNPCEHVMAYRVIGKVKDDTQRMQLFARFVAKYKGSREDNWVNCVLCDQHLVCYHEVLQLQEFLRPREKEVLHKELLLAFSGGQFQGRFMCRNCGQGISELEFDQSLEFTDDGVPMSGRAALEDEDAAAQEQLEDVLGGEIGMEEITFKTDTQTTIYKAARKVMDTLGLNVKSDVYQRIVQRVESEILKLPSRADYATATKGKRAVDYDILVNRVLVGALGANVLVEVQTAIPGYIIRYRIPGCRAGFSGYPTGSSDKDRTGLEYVACAIAMIRENAAPWNLTGFQREANEAKRREAVIATMEKLLGSLLTNAGAQQQIAAKREYLQNTYGSVALSEQLPEFIPAGFLPLPFKGTEEETKEGAEIVPAAATPAEAVRAWILQAHRIAKESGSYIRGAMTAEAQCCQAPITEPGAFWREKEGAMAALPLKAPPRGPVRGHVAVHFKARPQTRLETMITPDVMYRIFLKVCYDGPNIGLPHEPGYTRECQHCGFVFPENPYAPRPFPPMSADAKTQKEMLKAYVEEVEAIVTKGKVALETQRVDINERTFATLVDTTHRRFQVEPPKREMPEAGMRLVEAMRSMDPPPFEGWRELMASLAERLARLPPGAEEVDVAEAYGPVSNFAADVLDDFRARLGEDNAAALRSVLESGPAAAAESLWTYVLVPFQRLCTNIAPGATTMGVQKSYKLSPQTEEDIRKLLDFHVRHIAALAPRAKGFTLLKLRWARSRLAEAIRFLKTAVRGPYIPGGGVGVPYLTVALLGGILSEFMNPNVVPPGGGEGAAAVDTGARAPIQILDVLVQKLRGEGLNFTPEQIREAIEDRTRRENAIFTRKYDNMTPEQKQVEKMKKKLGLGEWAVGGTAAVYRYDEAMYEFERKQREAMGLGALFDDGAGPIVALDDDERPGPTREDGYDVAQEREDDA